jgi:hypothetical protein
MAIAVPNAVDYLNPRLWTGIVKDFPIPMTYMGNSLLPIREVPGDKLMWDMEKARNILAPFVAVDAESPRMSPREITQAQADVLYIKFKRSLAASDVRILREFGTAPILTLQANMAAAARARIVGIAEELSKTVDARVEWMQIQALTGGFTIAPNPLSQLGFTMAYPINQVAPATLWTDVVNSDPLADIQSWMLQLTYPLTRMVIGRVVLYNLLRNQKLIRQLGFSAGMPSGNAPTSVGQDKILQFFSTALGLNVQVYDARYTTEVDNGTVTTETVTKFLPDNKVIFLPDQPVGYTASAPAEQNNFQSGKFSWVQDPNAPGAKKDPYVYELGVGFYGVPIVEYAGWVVCATVG